MWPLIIQRRSAREAAATSEQSLVDGKPSLTRGPGHRAGLSCGPLSVAGIIGVGPSEDDGNREAWRLLGIAHTAISELPLSSHTTAGSGRTKAGERPAGAGEGNIG